MTNRRLYLGKVGPAVRGLNALPPARSWIVTSTNLRDCIADCKAQSKATGETWAVLAKPWSPGDLHNTYDYPTFCGMATVVATGQEEAR